jgi:hypothetical protein
MKWVAILVIVVSLGLYTQGAVGLKPILFVAVYFGVLYLLYAMFPQFFEKWLG